MVMTIVQTYAVIAYTLYDSSFQDFISAVRAAQLYKDQ